MTPARIRVSPTVTAGAYDAGDAVGGKLTFELNPPHRRGRIIGVTVIDRAQVKAELNLALYEADVSTIADNASYAPTAADLLKLVGLVNIPAAAYVDSASESVAHIQVDGPCYELTPPSESVYGQLSTPGTPTYVATTDLTVILHVEKE